jgi:predicted alpha/beta-fold hydrolase
MQNCWCRGCGRLPLESPRSYCATDTADLHAAVCEVARMHPRAPLLLAGFSIGALLVTKYLADLERGVYEPGEPLGWSAPCFAPARMQ